MDGRLYTIVKLIWKLIQSGFTQSVQTSHVTPLSSSSQPQSGAVYNVHATQVKRLGYINDLAAEANISLAVDKLSPDLQVKWKDHVRTSNLHQPNLEDFCSWLKGQADIYDDCFKFPFRGRYGGAGEKHNTLVS